eukprot:CAMPEP_0194585688 /NCGR_PEP_ID=MMETSP0292-20121207/17928_1 /TAXON_ID=39354 /ORGANISM="Heterosigma akashiwo, Strain CCMP2393" /LENGTH=43 /DNA_ID= /DNA_START= /DNA_END= /DNA_ORIENTATION=
MVFITIKYSEIKVTPNGDGEEGEEAPGEGAEANGLVELRVQHH